MAPRLPGVLAQMQNAKRRMDDRRTRRFIRRNGKVEITIVPKKGFENVIPSDGRIRNPKSEISKQIRNSI
jgi:hypothetical protein